METLYGLKIYVMTPEGNYNYRDDVVYTKKIRAYNMKTKILKHRNPDKLITHIDVVEFYLDSRES